MPQGLEVYGADGRLEIAVTTRLTKILGSFNTGIALDGFVPISTSLLGGQVFWFNVIYTDGDGGRVGPEVFYQNGGLGWRFYPEGAWNPSLFAPPVNSRSNARVIYGVR